MTRKEYEEKVWSVTDEEWDKLVKEGLVPENHLVRVFTQVMIKQRHLGRSLRN